MSKQFLTAEDIAKIMGYSVRHSYKIIKQLNGELTKKGYITRTGRIPRKYFYERTGLDPEEAT